MLLMGGSPGRLELLAAVVTLAGLWIGGRSLVRLARAARARCTYGAPYKSGMISERLIGFLMTLPVLILGSALIFLALAQAAFQPAGTTVRVGRIEATRCGPGCVTARFIPDSSYPAREAAERRLSGVQWAIAGDFIDWDRGVKWLGLRAGHRVRYLYGTHDPTGALPEDEEGIIPLEPLPPAAEHLLAMARFIPFLQVESHASRWIIPADRQLVDLYAIDNGYLVEVVGEGGASDPADWVPR